MYQTRKVGQKTEQVLDYVLASQKYPNGYWPDNGVPKVALMFLLTSGLPHEPLWRLFFEAAAGLRLKRSPPVEPDQPLSDILPPGRCRHSDFGSSDYEAEPHIPDKVRYKPNPMYKASEEQLSPAARRYVRSDNASALYEM